MSGSTLKCIKMVAKEYGISVDEATEIITTSQDCIFYEGECISPSFPDADLINSDPDKYVNERHITTEALEKMVKLSAFLYFNYDGGGLTDNSFDALQYHLNKRLRIQGRRYDKIGAEPVERIRTKLPYPMPSLEKMYPGERSLLEFVTRPLTWSDKLDGVSGLVVYQDGAITGIYTRGDGAIGGNVLHLKDYVELPELPELEGTLAVRGEFVISRSKWLKYENDYSNPRSFVSSKVNQGYISDALYDVEFVAYEVMDSTSTNQFDILENLGFTVPEHGAFPASTPIFTIMTLYKKRREESLYDIDGLVLQTSQGKKAFKMRLVEQQRPTKVLDIDWSITRYGRYFPVAVYEGVYVNGVRLHRASAHNAHHVKNWSMGRGTQIVIVRAGDVIPQIHSVTVDKSIKPIYPTSERGRWSWKGSDIILNDIENNREVQIKRITHFFETIGVPGLGEKTAEKLWEAGFTDIKAVASAKEDDLIKLQGFGKIKSQKMYNDIHTTMRKTRIDRFIPASTTLDVGIGRKLIKDLLRGFPDVFERTEAEIKEYLNRVKVPGFGAKRIDTVSKGVPAFRDFLFSLNKDDIKHAIAHNKKVVAQLKKNGYNPKVKGKVFVLTGFYSSTNYDLEDYIYDNLGDFGTVVGKTTEAVIAANLLDVTKKMTDAVVHNVPVYSVEEFVKAYNVKYDD